MEKYSQLKKFGYALGVIILIWILFRACSSSIDYFEPEYKIGRDETWYPTALYGKEKNMLGFTNELFLKIAGMEDFRVSLYQKNQSGLLGSLESGELDGVISSLLPTAANKDRYHFSSPIYLTGPVLIVLKGDHIQSLESLNRGTIAFRRGDNIDIDFTQHPGVNLRVYDSYASAVQALTHDRVDAILMDVIPAHNTIQGFYAQKMVIATKPLNDKGLRLITLKTPKGSALVHSFNEGLEKLKRDGEFLNLLNSWQLIDTESLGK